MASQTSNLPASRRPFPFGKTVGRTVSYTILLLGTLVTLVPFVWAVLTSLKPSSEIVRVPPTFFPETWTLKAYQTIFNDPNVPLGRFYINSLAVAGARVAITLFTSSLAGFIFAKYRFWGKRITFGFILVQLMIPFQVVMIPAYLILVKLGLVDSLWGLIIPSMVDAFGIFLMRQFIESIPTRADGRCPGRRRPGVPHLLEHHLAPARGGPGDAGHLHLHGHLERLPVAADRDHHPRAQDAAAAADLVFVAAQHALRPDDGGLGAGAAADFVRIHPFPTLDRARRGADGI